MSGAKVTALRGSAINLGDAADEFLGTHRVSNDDKTRHKNPRTAMRYPRPGGEAAAEITGILAPPCRSH
ncbi:hypothetical protein [Actinocorallia longicatena]|uniref:Uncharacterized protein n=1 Tax=Actinocorallia longicatena TaxID=111803 RepID=A0ABP6QD04_9ACTN